MNIKRKFPGFQLLALSIAVLFLFIIQFIGFGCGKGTEPKNNPGGSMTNYDGCISYLSAAKDNLVPPCCTGFNYEYDNEEGTLSLAHFGAGFNCCTDLSAEITFNDSLILIDENESGEFCFCLCLYDVDYELENITQGIYTIRFMEPYANDEDIPLELTIDLALEPTGSHSVERNHYPWEE